MGKYLLRHLHSTPPCSELLDAQAALSGNSLIDIS